MDDIEAILDRMEHQAATLGCFPPPSPLLGPTPDTCMELLQGLRGPELGKGMTCTVAQCAAQRAYALKTVHSQHKYEWLREVSRMRRLPPLSVLQSVFATADLVSLLPRLWPLPQHMEASALARMKNDISAALELMHQHNMVHADIHAGNIMMRPQPACYVLIDYGGCSGDTVYPLKLGYGAIGSGGSLHRPPHHEADPCPVRTAYGDYYRLAQTIKSHLNRGERPHTGSRKRTKTLPHHVDKELQNWIDREALPIPTSPSSPFPPGTWIQSAINPQVLVTAFLWNKERDPGSSRPPTPNSFCKGPSAKGRSFANDDGYLVAEHPPPPPPLPEEDSDTTDLTQSGDGGIARGQPADEGFVPPLQGVWAPYPHETSPEEPSSHRERVREASKLLEEAITALPDTDADMTVGATRYVPLEDNTSICASAKAHLSGSADSMRPTGAWAGALRFAADVLQEVAKDLDPSNTASSAPRTITPAEMTTKRGVLTPELTAQLG
ncbi:GALNT6 [Symbiodinium sp. CCMP2456]|nr:GALNT6 [Symbiodinium sp. CCMP2456]